jgi:hypothetical protein
MYKMKKLKSGQQGPTKGQYLDNAVGLLGNFKYDKKKLRGFTPQANYADRAIAAGQRS